MLIQVNREEASPVDPFFALIGLTCALGAFYLATLTFAASLMAVRLPVRRRRPVSPFIYLTGGITSNFPSLYLPPIVAASIIGAPAAGLSACRL
jgi:hypothetical protein